MPLILPDHKLATADELRAVVRHIMERCSGEASRSQYDVMVCVRSVAAAREVFEAVPVEGSLEDYGAAVMSALDVLRDEFYDPDGEYTSKGMVGDVGSDVYQLLKSQASADVVDVDREEAGVILTQEINDLARLTPQPPMGLGDATIRADASGPSGADYFVRMTIEHMSDKRFAVAGGIYTSETSRFPVLEERLEFDIPTRSRSSE